MGFEERESWDFVLFLLKYLLGLLGWRRSFCGRRGVVVFYFFVVEVRGFFVSMIDLYRDVLEGVLGC